jgi:hypothetical protein
MSEQRFHLVIREVKTGHPFIEPARAYQSRDFGVGM